MSLNEKTAGKGLQRSAIIVIPWFAKRPKSENDEAVEGKFFRSSSEHRSREEIEEEITGLANAINLKIQQVCHFNIKRPVSATLFGKGQLDKAGHVIEDHKPDVVIVNHALSPVQQRNLEKKWSCKVIDRTGLILEIFGERARTKEGKLQVELATLKYARSRLVRSWTHLERQRGGLGFVGGPGETQLEIDKRLINQRIDRLEKDIEQVRKTRNLQRVRRERHNVPVISLVGYTNAGKSTLFNSLTGENIYAKDLLFATLDPTIREIDFPEGETALLTDTVGFISDLPTDLIAAFRATLEQIQYADVILHVRDISCEDTEAQRQDVIHVLEGLGIDYHGDRRIIEAWNKLDAMPENTQRTLHNQAALCHNPPAVTLSAKTGRGLDDLKDILAETLHQDDLRIRLDIPHAQGRAMSWLHENARVLEKKQNREFMTFFIDIDRPAYLRFLSEFPKIKPESSAHSNEKDTDTNISQIK